MTRATVRAVLPRYQRRTSYSDNFCLAPRPGIRVGYAHGKAILILTANPHYSHAGVKIAMTVAQASAHLHLGTRIHWDVNTWYIIRAGKLTIVLKVRHSLVKEIGIAKTTHRAKLARLLDRF